LLLGLWFCVQNCCSLFLFSCSYSFVLRNWKKKLKMRNEMRFFRFFFLKCFRFVFGDVFLACFVFWLYTMEKSTLKANILGFRFFLFQSWPLFFLYVVRWIFLFLGLV
jgi:hypothetical protein